MREAFGQNPQMPSYLSEDQVERRLDEYVHEATKLIERIRRGGREGLRPDRRVRFLSSLLHALKPLLDDTGARRLVDVCET